MTTAHPAASQVLPGPELLYPRKDTFPKAVWGGGRRGEASLQPNSSSSFKNYKRKKKSHNPVVASTLTRCWRLKQEGRAGHSHGKSDRNTDPEFHSCHRGPAEPEPPVQVVLGRGHQEQQCQAGDTRSPPLGECPGEGSASCATGTPITIPGHPILPRSHLDSEHYPLSPRFPRKAGQTGTQFTHRCTHAV